MNLKKISRFTKKFMNRWSKNDYIAAMKTTLGIDVKVRDDIFGNGFQTQGVFQIRWKKDSKNLPRMAIPKIVLMLELFGVYY